MSEKTILDLYRNELERPRADHYRHVTLTGVKIMSTRDFFETTAALAEGLAAFGVGPGDRVLLISDNRPEWHQVDIATLSLGAVTVPVYPTLTTKGVIYHARDSGAVVAVTENQLQTRKITQKREECPDLKLIIQIEDDSQGDVLEYSDVVATHRHPKPDERFWARAQKVSPDDLASIVYTSGTTGNPKGVMLTHRNFTSNVEAVMPRVSIRSSDEAIEFLPLCHVFERTCGYAYMDRGLTRSYCAPAVVADHIREIAPTVFASVPRLFEKIHSRVMTRVDGAPPLRRKLFHWAVATGRQAAALRLEGDSPPLWLALKHRIADALVLKKIRAAFGGRVRLALSGGAPLAPELNWFFHSVGISLQEGYGLTETSPAIGIGGFQPGENRIGAVGKVLPNLEAKLAADGELLVKGPSISQGYWNNPEATAEVFDGDGFLLTGDIARIDEDGFLFITDRKKDIIIPAGGKNVAPQPIENALKAALFIDNAVLIGDQKPYIVALISPSEEELYAWASTKGMGGRDLGDLLADPLVKRAFESAIADVNAHLDHFEQVKKFRVLPKPLTIEDGFLTPTLKVKRREVARANTHLIADMYA